MGMSLGLNLSLGSSTLNTGGGVPWRQAANNSHQPSGFFATNKQIGSRTQHIAKAAINGLKLQFENWYCTNVHPVAETLPGADAAITASVEYNGTIYQAKFSGSNQGTIPNGGSILSDEIGVVIPKGAAFYVRSYFTSTAGILFNNKAFSGTEQAEFAPSGITDKTLSGTIPAASSTYGPSAIVTRTNDDAYVVFGDSRVYGQTDTPNSTLDLGPVSRGIGQAHPIIAVGCPTDRLTQFLTSGYSRRISLAQWANKVIGAFGTNDIVRAGRTKAQLEADVTTFAGLFGSKPVWFGTINPESGSSDSWATTANQTTNGTNPTRVGFNDDLRNGLILGLVGYFELSDPVESARNSGIWKAPGYTPDGIHEGAVAAIAIRDSGIWPA